MVSWRPSGDGEEVPPPGGADAVVWAWRLRAQGSGEERTVLVKVSGTAMASDDVHFRVLNARRTKGQTEIQRVLEWDEPPSSIEFHSRSVAPSFEGGRPGAGVQELAEIVEWFEKQGLVLLLSSRHLGVGQGTEPYHSVHTANVINYAADELLARFEASSRLQAAREAKAAFEARDDQSVGPDVGTQRADFSMPQLEADRVSELRRCGFHLVWTGPHPDEPDSGWMLEVVDDNGDLCAIAVQKTPDDALLTVLEDLIPHASSED